jgi:hypothetical protein
METAININGFFLFEKKEHTQQNKKIKKTRIK